MNTCEDDPLGLGKQPDVCEGALEALKDVIDPELGVNIVDLGLVYGVSLDEARVLSVRITLTNPGCPLADVIEEQIAYSLQSVCDSYRLEWVWFPPWTPERISHDGREMMRALGFAL